MAADPEPRRQEWLDVGARRFGPRDLRVLVLALALALIIAGVSVAAYHRSAVTSPEPGPDAPTASTPPDPSAPPTGTAPVQVRLGHPLLPTAAGWQVVGYGPTGIVRVDPGAGVIITTPVPTIPSNAPVVITTAARYVVIRPIDDVTGYVVRDGSPAQTLTGLLQDARTVLPGPDPRHVWAMTTPDTLPGSTRVDLQLADDRGRRVGAPLPAPRATTGTGRSDGAGRVLLTGTGGVYLTRSSGLTKITSGDLVAIGPTRILTNDCDDRGVCQAWITERADGRRHRFSTTPEVAGGDPGQVSPDGRWATITRQTDDGAQIVLIDLDTGTRRSADRRVNGFGLQDQAWSPDGRWLLATDQTQLFAIDPVTGRSTVLGEAPASLMAIVVRPAP